MDMDFATSCPLVRPALPRIRFLFVGSRFRSTLPSDGPSRFRPCASLVLHLHQVAQGTFTPRLLDMPSTQARRTPSGCTNQGQTKNEQTVMLFFVTALSDSCAGVSPSCRSSRTRFVVGRPSPQHQASQRGQADARP